MTNDLKPCPFCGGEAEESLLVVFCTQCGVRTQNYSSTLGNYQAEQAAVKRFWNTRTESPSTDSVKDIFTDEANLKAQISSNRIDQIQVHAEDGHKFGASTNSVILELIGHIRAVEKVRDQWCWEYVTLRDTPKQESHQPVDWTEDAKHENGNYGCRCAICGRSFIGHKRRVVCKLCDTLHVKIKTALCLDMDRDEDDIASAVIQVIQPYLSATMRESVALAYDDDFVRDIAWQIEAGLESEENYHQVADRLTKKFKITRIEGEGST